MEAGAATLAVEQQAFERATRSRLLSASQAQCYGLS